jgi:hypothetical protein
MFVQSERMYLYISSSSFADIGIEDQTLQSCEAAIFFFCLFHRCCTEHRSTITHSTMFGKLR